MDELIERYVETFNEYPSFYLSGFHKDALRDVLIKALLSGVPINPQYVKGGVY